MKKTTMFKNAHELAHEIVSEYGDYQIAFSFALKEVWRQVKLYDKKRFGAVAIFTATQRLTTPKRPKNDNIDGVPTWILRENLSQGELFAVENCGCGSTVRRETEKALLIAFDTNFGAVTVWVPKSVMAAVA